MIAAIALTFVLTTLVVGLSMGFPLWITAVKREAAEIAAEAWREEAEANAADARALRTQLASAHADAEQAETRAEVAAIRIDAQESTIAIKDWQIATLEQARDWHDESHWCLPGIDGIRALSADDFDAAMERLRERRAASNVVELRRGGA